MTPKEALTISSCPLFDQISDDEVLEIFKTVPFTTKSYEKNALVMIRGDEYDSLRILLKGEVSAEIQGFQWQKPLKLKI